VENHDSLHFERQEYKSKYAGRSLHYGLSAPPRASRAFVPGVVSETQTML